MNKAQIMSLLDIYESWKIPKVNEMIEKMRDMDDELKLNRWVGFIQGILWKDGIYTVDNMRHQVIKVLSKDEEEKGVLVQNAASIYDKGDFWCECKLEDLTIVARDFKTTCGKCGGVDAYGEDEARPPHLKKNDIGLRTQDEIDAFRSDVQQCIELLVKPPNREREGKFPDDKVLKECFEEVDGGVDYICLLHGDYHKFREKYRRKVRYETDAKVMVLGVLGRFAEVPMVVIRRGQGLKPGQLRLVNVKKNFVFNLKFTKSRKKRCGRR
jgi:hypothetical protein